MPHVASVPQAPAATFAPNLAKRRLNVSQRHFLRLTDVASIPQRFGVFYRIFAHVPSENDGPRCRGPEPAVTKWILAVGSF